MQGNMKIYNLIIVLFLIIFEVGCSNDTNESQLPNPGNGDLNETFVDPDTASNTTQVELSETDRLLLEGWEEKSIQNGQLPSCYNFKPKRGSVSNYLEVSVGGGTDVSIKVMDINSEKCIRYVFINSGSTYNIRNIPEGRYYLKIAYGKHWVSKSENGKCIGKFTSNQLYEKGQDVLDYNLQYTDGGYSVPSFKLQLDVISTGTSNSFNSQNISETEFNE
jgi:hypothetical protein